MANSSSGIELGITLPEGLSHEFPPRPVLVHYLLLRKNILALRKDLVKHSTAQNESFKASGSSLVTSLLQELKRLETAMNAKIDKDVAALAEAHSFRIDDILKKREKVALDRHEKLRAALLRMTQTELPHIIAESLQKELMAIIPHLEKLMVPAMYMPLESSADVAMQAGLCDPLARQLEKTLCATLTGGLQAQLGPSKLAAAIRPPLEEILSQLVTSSLAPAVQRACRTVLGRVDGALATGTRERLTQLAPDTTAEAQALQASALRAGELASQVRAYVWQSQQAMQAAVTDAFRQLANAGVGAGAGQGGAGAMGGSQPAQVDPREEISQLLAEGRHEDAFQLALSRADPALPLWLCRQLDASSLLSSGDGSPLSQGVLLSLVQQLGAGPMDDVDAASVRLEWIREAAMALDATNVPYASMARPMLGVVHQSLQQAAAGARGELRAPLRLATHVLASVLSQLA
eukprot:jgi/Mesvir1/25353/Mv22453-RA.1